MVGHLAHVVVLVHRNCWNLEAVARQLHPKVRRHDAQKVQEVKMKIEDSRFAVRGEG